MAIQQDTEDYTDEVLDEYHADHGVKVERVERNGLRENQEIIKVYGTREDRYAGFDGGSTTRERQVVIGEMPAGNAYEVLIGLAEAHGYDLEGK